jgi:DDE superfamily endonuclease
MRGFGVSKQSLTPLLEGCERVYLDGIERSVQRHHDEATQKKDYSGKKSPYQREPDSVYRRTTRRLSWTNLLVRQVSFVVMLRQAQHEDSSDLHPELVEGQYVRICLMDYYSGSAVDITMAKEQSFCFPADIELLVDLGFQGFHLPNVEVIIPHKKPKNKTLSQEQKDDNPLVASARVVNEHSISGIERSRCVKEKFRNWKRDFVDTAMVIATALHNLRVSSRAIYKASTA